MQNSTTTNGGAPAQKDATGEDRVLTGVYDKLLQSVRLDAALAVHNLIKTGEMSMSNLSEPISRQMLYPELYKVGDNVEAILEQYSTETPLSSKRKRVEATPDAENEATKQSKLADGIKEMVPTVTTRQASTQVDIWGRIPPKEPRCTCECRICGRQVSALRFAPHLDKCMGLSSRPSSGATQRGA